MRKIVNVVFVFGVAIAIVIGFYHKNIKADEWAQSKPDNTVRSAVAHISADQIAAIRLEILPDMLIITPKAHKPPKNKLGMQPGFEYEYKTDSTAIRLLLRGLQKAQRPEPYCLNRISCITLILNDGSVRGPFGFSRERKVDCFSPTFIRGLEKVGARSFPKN